MEVENETLLFDQTIKKMEPALRYGGFNIRNTKVTLMDTIKIKMIYINNWFWLNFDLAGGIYWFIDGVRTGKDFLGLTFIAPCIFISTLCTIKGVFLVTNEKPIQKLMTKLRNFEKKEKERAYSEEKEEIIKKERDFLHIVINLVNWLYFILLTLFAISPIGIMAFRYSNTGELDLILPFLILYPFDPFNPKVYPFVYVHQIWSGMNVLLALIYHIPSLMYWFRLLSFTALNTKCIVYLNSCSADYFFFTSCTYLRIQFKLLRYNIENIIPIPNGSRSKFLDDDSFKAVFRDLVQWHQDLIESAQILESIYSKSTLVNFLSSSMIICLSGFNVTIVKDVTYVISFLSFLSLSLFQVLFLCFFADLLISSSREIADAVYRSQWYMAEASVRKKLLIMQIRSQKPVKLTAFGFADVNLNSFMRVLSTAWSYFALLQTIYGGH